MPNFEINKRFENIPIPGVSNEFFSYAKKIFGELIKFEPYIIEEFSKIKRNFLLEEENFDFLYSTENEYELIEKGFKLTTENKFHNEQYNNCYLKQIDEIKKIKTLSKIIDYNEDVLIFKKNINNIEVYKNQLNYKLLDIKCINGEVVDFGFDEKGNFFIIYKNNEDKFNLIKTNKTFNFFQEFNYDHQVLNLSSCESFFNIIIDTNIDLSSSFIVSDNKSNLYIVTNNIKNKIILNKKYYCFRNGKYYYNDIKYDNGKIEKGISIEHLFIYELLSFYGLKDLKIKDNNGIENIKINSTWNEKIKKLLSFKFDNTLNGTINFFNFLSGKNPIDINNGKLICKGNFNYDQSEIGYYKIKIKIIESCYSINDNIKFSLQFFFSKNGTDYKIISENIFNTVSSSDGYNRCFYFKNLEFKFYNFYYNKDNEFEFSFFNDNIKEINFEKTNIIAKNQIINKIKNIDYKIHNPKNFVFDKEMIRGNLNFSFDNGYLIFKNVMLNNKSLFKSKTTKNNFLIPFLDNNKPTEIFKSLSKKSYYVNIEDVIHFESKDIIEQIKKNKEITIIV